jgi:hypothetical protein
MGQWSPCSHGEDRVEQKYSLRGPAGEIRLRGGECDPKVRLNLLEEVEEAWGLRGQSVRYGKASSDRLSWSVIGILSENDDSDVITLHFVESGENQRSGGIDGMA